MSGACRIALVGNPNSGKTTLFNALTGQRQRATNYPGVTVEHVLGTCSVAGSEMTVVDLPGCYSLDAASPDERVARDFLVVQRPEVVLQVVDATALERHLYLTSQLLELGVNLVLVLTMMDRARAAGLKIDTALIAERLSVPVLETVGPSGEGIARLLEVVAARSHKPGVALEPDYGDEMREAIDAVEREIAACGSACDLPYPRRWLALKLLEREPCVMRQVQQCSHSVCREVASSASARAAAIEGHHGDALAILIAERRQGFASGLAREAVTRKRLDRQSLSDQIDDVLTHRWLGIPIFLLVMYLVFYATFTLGAVPMGWIEHGIGFLAMRFQGLLVGHDALRSFVVDGILGGVGNVLLFVPNIAILFACISVIEDSGYMARAAFITDRFMHQIGLHGKSIIPLLIGFGCSVPAVMATRTLENRRDRLATMLVIPLMSCGARLPIYLMFIPAFFPQSWQAPVLWGMYFTGIVLAVILVRLLRMTVLSGESVPFVMELPPYRMPVLKGVLIHVWFRTWMYLKKAGTVILVASAIMWFITSYPKPPHVPHVEATHAVGTGDAVSHSFAGQIGRALEPVTESLGFDWRVNTAFLGALAAKELFVAQMGILSSLEGKLHEDPSLMSWLRSEYTPAQALSIMLFILIAAPCSATVAVTAREAGRWRIALAQYFGLTLLAAVVSFIVYHVGTILLGG